MHTESVNNISDLSYFGIMKFEDGGHWKGKNYVFDKRFAHAPPKVCTDEEPLSKCEKCHKPWDKFKNKRRCPTCGVPSLVCKDCFDAYPEIKKDKSLRCDLCVKQNITSKYQWRDIERKELEEFEAKKYKSDSSKQEVKKSLNGIDSSKFKIDPNEEGITRLFLANLCTKNMNEEVLCEFLPGITHLLWVTDRKTGKFFGKAFVEMKTPEDAGNAVGKNGMKVLGRSIRIQYQKADCKDMWPPPNSKL